MPQKLLEAVKAVRFPIPGICLVLPLLEGSPAVGADEALGVELVPHRRDDSALARLGADTALVLGRRVVWNNRVTDHNRSHQITSDHIRSHLTGW